MFVLHTPKLFLQSVPWAVGERKAHSMLIIVGLLELDAWGPRHNYCIKEVQDSIFFDTNSIIMGSKHLLPSNSNPNSSPKNARTHIP